MLAVLGTVAGGVVIFLWEGIGLFKQKKKKEMIIFSTLLLLAATLEIGVVLHLSIPSPTEMIAKLLDPVTKPIVHWIKGGAS